MAKTAEKKCVIAGCDERATCKGLCPTDYRAALRKVNTGETTWEKLAAAGLARLRPGNKFEKAFAAARNGASKQRANGR